MSNPDQRQWQWTSEYFEPHRVIENRQPSGSDTDLPTPLQELKELDNSCTIVSRKIPNQIGIVNCQGVLDVYSAPRLKEILRELLESGHCRTVMNLNGSRLIDACGMGVLTSLRPEFIDQGGKIVLVCTNPGLKKQFRLTGLFQLFDNYNSEEQALGAFEPIAQELQLDTQIEH